jgi:glyoxylase-like metal-dependent hydrolase (beta-lactamase superfamily II)
LPEEVLPGIFRIEVPLPRNPLRYLNSYLIKGDNRCLLVDTGFNWPECRAALTNGIEELGVKWSQVDFFITHGHGDHFGLVYDLSQQDSAVYCSRTDADMIRSYVTAAFWQRVDAFYLLHGYPAERLQNHFENINNYLSGAQIDYKYTQEGDIIQVGDYHLECVFTPGHSPGHMCLYEPSHKLLLSGDLILSSITSNITAWCGIDDFLGRYLESLDKIDAMNVSLVLPGHREIIHDCRERITQLKDHHRKRLEEILYILHNGPMNAYQVASQMHWDLSYESWDEFPSFQQWFATGEAIAHLEHLSARKDVARINYKENVIYELS